MTKGWTGAAVTVALACAASTASAQVGFALHTEGGAAMMLSSHQRDVLGYDAGFTGISRLSLRLADVFGVQGGAGSLWFPSDDGFGQLFLAGGGLRLEPSLGGVGRLFIDGNAYYAMTGDLNRFAIDVGLGFQFLAADVFSVGPYVRYTHGLASEDNDGGDASILSFGLTMAVHSSSAPAAVDTDGDGVLDPDDLCPRQPQGERPDPERRGCPLTDSDGDGVYDRDDVCPYEAAGSDPDPERRGCPTPDTDRDGVNDRRDVCPSTPAGDDPDPSRPGCPLPDTDGDGVFDPQDACPTTPAGTFPDPNRPGCPDGDNDSDTVRNSQDTCPDQHQGFHPDPNRPGCPQPDRDNDMVPDAVDACPTRPGAPSQNPRRNGCPSLVRVEVDRILIQRPVFFATNADRILPRSAPVLRALADALLAMPAIRRVSIEGHTDDVGEDDFNLDLSNRRAANVMQWLIDNGIEASRLESRGFGESRPLAEGTSRRARATNRRVEFRVIDPAPPSSAAEGDR